MGRVDVGKLKSELDAALRKNKTAKVLELYQQLELAEPQEGLWPQRLADSHARNGNPKLELAALVRASERYSQSGFLLKAIAICKRILALDPAHDETERVMQTLCVKYGIPEPDPRIRPRTAASRPSPEASPPSKPCVPVGEPLEMMILADLDDDTQPTLVTKKSEGICEIQLDEEPAVPKEDSQVHAQLARETLPRTPLFWELESAALQELVKTVRLVRMEAGDELFHEGDTGDCLFVVAQGELRVIAEEEPRKELALLGEEEFLGETALITQRPRNATVEAHVDSSVLAIDRPLISSLIEHDPWVLPVLLRFLRSRLVDRLVQTSGIFSPLSLEARRQLARRFRFLEVTPDTRLIEQGAPSPDLFILLSGEIEVLHEQDGSQQRLAKLATGDVFGEMSILSGEPAVANAITSSKSWLLALSREEATRLLSSGGSVQGEVEKLAAKRRSRNAALLDRNLNLV